MNVILKIFILKVIIIKKLGNTENVWNRENRIQIREKSNGK